MLFAQFLQDNGWYEKKPFEFIKNDWVIVFDTSSWMEVGTNKNPRLRDIPVPKNEEMQKTLDLIENLCKTYEESNH